MNPDSALNQLWTAKNGLDANSVFERRLRHVLERYDAGMVLSPADFVVLIRAVCRCRTIRRGWQESIAIPTELVERIGVQKNHWDRASLIVREVGPGELLVASRPWQPTWLEGSDATPVDESLYQGPSFEDSEVPADPPLIRTMGFQKYRSDAQREAVRAAISMPPGSTLIVNLPTGSGKSICGFLPALLGNVDDPELPGTTPIVVPTVALAFDLERKLQREESHHIAYRPQDSGSADATRLRCAAGLQGPVLVSPESLIGSLRESLRVAAKKGHVRHLVIDEAHMITAWGDEFRPAFQQIASVRRELIHLARANGHSPPATILLSATLTEYNMRALHELFVDDDPVRLLHAVRLRPEPAYWMARSSTESRRAWMLEALWQLPRPLIVYTLKRSTAERCTRDIREAGFARVAMMHGGTDDEERRRVLTAWERDELDVVVATSAFGLGVDKPDVRAVLHVELPESIDRFYQEVGRGGRDGQLSLSLLIWSDWDRRAARKLSQPTYIGEERGRERWLAMFQNKRIIDIAANLFAIPIDVPPLPKARDIDMDSDENRLWNVRTLLLMSRAGVLEFADPTTNQDSAATNDDQHFPSEIGIRLLRPDHCDAATWNRVIEARREDLLHSARASFSLLEAMLQQDRCLSHLLEQCYRSDAYAVPIVRSCGGCPNCRRNSTPPLAGRLRSRKSPDEPWPQWVPLGTEIRQWLGKTNVGCLVYSQDPERREHQLLPRMVQWMVREGIRTIVVRPNSEWDVAEIIRHIDAPILLNDELPQDITALLPLAVLVDRAAGPWWTRLWQAMFSPLTTMLVVLPEDATEPNRPQRCAIEFWNGRRLTFSQWEEDFCL